MTVTINALQFEFSINATVPLGDVNVDITSQYSKEKIISQIATVVTSNERYSTISVFLAEELASKHYNGIYEYKVYSESNIYDEGLMKIVTEPGGGQGTRAYISNNEDREAKVVYRPSYEN